MTFIPNTMNSQDIYLRLDSMCQNVWTIRYETSDKRNDRDDQDFKTRMIFINQDGKKYVIM